MFKLSTSTLSAVAAVALAVGAAAPSFAWGWGGWGWPGNSQEIAARDNGLRREINNDRGRLSGQYGHLKAEDRAIKRQEQRDLCQNGGYLTNGQKRQLNAEENRLQHQINYDQNRW